MSTPTKTPQKKADTPSLFDEIEKTLFFTNRNVGILLASGIAGSLFLALLIPSRHVFLILSILVYTALSIVLFIIHVLRPQINYQRLLTIKSVADIILTVYWTNIYSWKTGSVLFYFLPVVMLMAITLYTNKKTRSRTISITLYTTVFFNGWIFPWLLHNDSLGILGIGIYYLMSGLALWAQLAHNALESTVRQEMASAEVRIDELVNTKKTFELAARLIRHDINNHLMKVYASTLKSNSDQGTNNYQQTYENLIEPINQRLQQLSHNTQNKIELFRVVQGLLPVQHAHVDIKQGVYVTLPFLLLVSFIQNICENAQEAYLYRNGTLDKFKISAILKNNTLEIEDNAGGFDTTNISIGNSSKGTGHGVFLATFLNDTEHLGFKSGISRSEHGTILKMTFEVVST